MEFSFQRVNSQMEDGYFNYTSFSDHEGLWSGTSVLRGSVDVIERRRREKERIREEIVAEEEARRRVLEAEVRRELMLEAQINGGGGGGGGYRRSSSTVMIGPPLSQLTTRLQPVVQPLQPLAPVEIYAGRRHREIGPFWSPGDVQPKVVDLPDGQTILKPPPPPAAAGGSSGIKRCSGGSEIGLGLAPKTPVKKQPSSIKNSRKCVSIDSKEEDKRTELSLWCSLCGVGATSETGMSQHKEGKKHMKNLEKLNRESRGHRALGVRKRCSGTKPKKTNRKRKSHKVVRHQ